MVAGSVVQNLYNITDSVIVGNFLGKEALAAVGASSPVIFTLISLVIGIGSGASTVVAQYFGAKDNRNVARTVDTVFIFFLLASVVVSLAGILFSGAIFRLIRIPEEIIPEAKIYMNIYLTGLFLMFGVNGLNSVLRGIGDSKTPLIIVSASAVLNLLLDLLFVVVLKWGIASVAFATVFSHGLAFAGTISYLNKKHPVLRISIRSMRFHSHIFKSCLRIGLPTGFQQSFVSLGMMAVMGIVSGFGVNAVAAYTAALRIDSFAKTPSFAFSAALSTFTAQNLGAGQEERVRKGLKSTLIMSTVYSVVITLLIIAFGQTIMTFFTNDPDVISIGQDYLVIVTSFYIFFSLMFAYTGLLRGAGVTFIPMLITLLTLWIFRIPLSVVMAKTGGINGVWWALVLTWVIGFFATWGYYLTGRWKNKGVIVSNKGVSNFD